MAETISSPNLGDGQQGEGGRGLAGGERQGARAALDRCHALLEHIGRRIHDPGVDVAEFFQREQIRGVLGVFENIGSGLVNGHRAGAGGGVGNLPGVKGQGRKTVGFIAHK